MVHNKGIKIVAVAPILTPDMQVSKFTHRFCHNTQPNRYLVVQERHIANDRSNNALFLIPMHYRKNSTWGVSNYASM
jgi:hypothetical protein